MRIEGIVSGSGPHVVRVELQDPAGQPLRGFTLGDCDEIFGDTLERAVTWREKSDVGSLVSKPIRLRMALQDADLFSLRFRD